MDVNGGSTARRWPKGILVRGLITVAQWPRVVPFANKYVLKYLTIGLELLIDVLLDRETLEISNVYTF